MQVFVACLLAFCQSVHVYLRPPTCGKGGFFSVFRKYTFPQCQNVTLGGLREKFYFNESKFGEKIIKFASLLLKGLLRNITERFADIPLHILHM